MRRYLALSMVASTLLMAGGVIVPVEPVVGVAAEQDYGEIFGQSRTFYLDRTYSGSLVNNRSSLATGGYIGYKTPDFNGFTAVVAAYGTYGFDIHDEDASVAGASAYDPALYGDNFENYAFIGQLYLNYAFGNTNIKIGRQQLDTPMVGSDDARMIPNLFEAAVLSNTDIDDTTLILAHITRETVGTFANVYPASLPSLAIQGGYGYGYKEGTNGRFADMGVITLGAGTDTAGVTASAIIYKGIENLTLQAWDYYAYDILNAVYLQADYGWNCLLNNDVKMTASAQYINERDVGDQLAGNVDSNYGAVKLNAAYGALSGYAAYSQAADSDGTMNGGILTPWGGMPAFTQGMVTRHMFFADTDATKVSGTYSFKEMTDLDLKASVYYISFNVGEVATYASGLSSSESGFDIEYQATKVLNLRFRGNFPRDFGDTADGPYNWDEYRLIANYNF